IHSLPELPTASPPGRAARRWMVADPLLADLEVRPIAVAVAEMVVVGVVGAVGNRRVAVAARLAWAAVPASGREVPGAPGLVGCPAIGVVPPVRGTAAPAEVLFLRRLARWKGSSAVVGTVSHDILPVACGIQH